MSNPRDRMINKYMAYLIDGNDISTKEIKFSENKHHEKQIISFRKSLENYMIFINRNYDLFDDKKHTFLKNSMSSIIIRCAVIISIYDGYGIEVGWNDKFMSNMVKVYNDADMMKISEMISKINKMKIDTKIKIEFIEILIAINKNIKNRTYTPMNII